MSELHLVETCREMGSMREYLKGLVLGLVVNALTILGWVYVGMWAPSVANVLLALLLLGIYGLEDKFAFPAGYWTVELFSFILWLTGVGGMLNLANQTGG